MSTYTDTEILDYLQSRLAKPGAMLDLRFINNQDMGYDENPISLYQGLPKEGKGNSVREVLAGIMAELGVEDAPQASENALAGAPVFTVAQARKVVEAGIAKNKALTTGLEFVGALILERDKACADVNRHERWMAQAREDAGFHRNDTFDNVWKAALAALREKQERELAQ